MKKVLKFGFFIIAAVGSISICCKAIKGLGDELKKVTQYWNFMSVWVYNLQNGIRLADILMKIGINKVAIYGFGNIGKLLLRELKNTDVEVMYIVDRASDDSCFDGCSIELIKPDKIISQKTTDAIIISSFYFYEEIKSSLEKSGANVKIISLEDLVYGTYRE